MRKLRLAEIMPDVSAGRFVETVHSAAEFHMQDFEHRLQAGRIVRRFGDEVIMIGEDRPSLQVPAVIFSHR